MRKRSLHEIRFLIVGVLLLWGGLTLLNAVRLAGASGQVVMHTKSDQTYTISARAATAQGLCLLLPGAAATLYGLSRMRLSGDNRRGVQPDMTADRGDVTPWSMIIAGLLFVAILGAFWNFVLRTIQ